MKLFTDLKLNFCIPTASLLLLASFGAEAQGFPPNNRWGGWGQPPTQQNPQQPIQQQPIQQQPIQQQPIQQQPIQQQPIQQQPSQQQQSQQQPSQQQPSQQQPNQQQQLPGSPTEQIAQLFNVVKNLTELNRRMMESATRYGACVTAVQTEMLSGSRALATDYRELSPEAEFRAHHRLLNKSNNCQRQFTDSFK